jgi:hypothetical protein
MDPIDYSIFFSHGNVSRDKFVRLKGLFHVKYFAGKYFLDFHVFVEKYFLENTFLCLFHENILQENWLMKNILQLTFKFSLLVEKYF